MAVPVAQLLLGAFESVHKLITLFLRNNFLGESQRPEAVKRKILARLLQGRSGLSLNLGFDNDLRSLQVIEDLLGLARLEQDPHLL